MSYNVESKDGESTTTKMTQKKLEQLKHLLLKQGEVPIGDRKAFVNLIVQLQDTILRSQSIYDRNIEIERMKLKEYIHHDQVTQLIDLLANFKEMKPLLLKKFIRQALDDNWNQCEIMLQSKSEFEKSKYDTQMKIMLE